MDELRRCHEELAALREENRQLKQAATAFGSLAERLTGELREERRKAVEDRRRQSRESAERRGT